MPICMPICPRKPVYRRLAVSTREEAPELHQDTLHPVVFDLSGKSGRFRVAGVTGLEPATSCVTGAPLVKSANFAPHLTPENKG